MENNTDNTSVVGEPKEAIEADQHHSHSHSHDRRATSLTKKEVNALRDHKYEDAVKKYNISYTVLNKKTGLIVEMKAASAVHACTMIGWKAKNCKLIKETIHEIEPEETVKEVA
jgi:hypothetical protein